MKKSKANITERDRPRNFAGLSLIVFLLDKLSSFIYDAFNNGLIGNIFTSYSKLQATLNSGFLKHYFSDSSRSRRFFRGIKKYFSRTFEDSLILNKIEHTFTAITSMPLKTLGISCFSFGVYVIIIYLIRLFLPVISAADIGFLITGVTVCIISIPMILARDNIAMSVGKSVILRGVFCGVFGFRDESFRKRTEFGRARNNLVIILGMLLGTLSLVIHPLIMIIAVCSMVLIALVVATPEIGIIFAIFFIPFLTFFDSPAVILAMIVLVITISYLIKLIRGKRIFRLEIIDLSVLLFGIIIYFSGAISAGGRAGFNEVLMTCELMLGYFLVVNLIRTEKWVNRCVFSLVSSGTIVAFVGVIQYVTGNLNITKIWLDTEYFYDIKGRAVSLFDNPNVLGMYLVLVLPFSLYTLINAPRGRAKLLGGISLTGILVCILFTWSRAAWISAIICILLFLLMNYKNTLRYLMLSLGILPVIPSLLPESVVRRFASIGDLSDSSTLYRVYTWRGTVKAIIDNIFSGVGYGTTAYQNIYPQYAYAGMEAAEHSHNLFLQITIGAGIFALIAFLIVIFLFLQMNFEYIKDFGEERSRLIASASICAIVAILVFGMFDFVWYNYRVFFLFWVIIAISCACVRIGRDERRRHSYNSNSDIS